MRTRLGHVLVLALALAVSACVSDPEPADAPTRSSVAPSETDTTPAAQDIMDFGWLGPVESGTYFLDADLDPLRVMYDIPAEGWSSWIGAAKFGPDDGHVAVSITTVVNLVTNGCKEHLAARPAVGPSVDDLATALAGLAPFQLTTAPEDVTIYGYSGKHLELTVPEAPFDRCDDGGLSSWIAPEDGEGLDGAFGGYTGPGYTEEFWILDVEGTRLMITAGTSPGSPSEDLAEREDLLGSIRIEA